MNKVRRIGALSCGLTLGCVYGLLGVLIGLFVAAFSLLGAGMAQLAEADGPAGGFAGLMFGMGAIVIFPIFYGVIGFVGGVLSALLYNLVAGVTGGIEVELT